jgi:phosphate transport system substrate-binding protein
MFVNVIIGLGLVLAAAFGPVTAAAVKETGSMIIVGNGPELPTIERLARAFEKGHVGSVIDIQWDQYGKPAALVQSGHAQMAVTGQADSKLSSIPIAWDGIAVVVYSTNPTKEVTMQQVADIFSGKVTRWAELSGQGTVIQLIDRPGNQNIRQSFEEVLGIVDQIPRASKVVRSDQTAMSTVAGNASAVTYTSLGVALDAVKYGVDVNLLMIDQVEAAKETVRDGRYKLRRPVLLLSKKESPPVVDAFIAFARSEEGRAIVDEMFVAYSPEKQVAVQLETEVLTAK